MNPDTAEQPEPDETTEQPGEADEPEQPGEADEPEQPGEADEPEQPGEGDEPEQPGEGDEPEQPTSPAPAPPTEADTAKMLRQLERSATSWRNSVSRILEEDAQVLEPCPLCPDNLPGFVYPLETIPHEVREAVIGWLRGGDTPDMKDDPDAEVCDVCDGHGHTLTGSKVPGNDTKLCGKCAGNGWTMPEQRAGWAALHPPTPPPQAEVIPMPVAAATSTGMPATDQWGRPLGNPNYGRDPNYMTPEERAADPWSPKP